MEHLQGLKPEQVEAVDKFKEYGAIIKLGFGNQPLYHDLVHSSSYPDNLINEAIARLRSKKNQLDEASDEGDTTSEFEFATYDRNGERVEFTTSDCLNYLRGIKRIRDYYGKKKELRDIDQKIAKLNKAGMTRTERVSLELQELQEQRNKLLGKPTPENKETATTPMGEGKE